MKRLTLMSMVVVAGLLVALAIAVAPRKDEGLLSLCTMMVRSGPTEHKVHKDWNGETPMEWWVRNCKI